MDTKQHFVFLLLACWDVTLSTNSMGCRTGKTCPPLMLRMPPREIIFKPEPNGYVHLNVEASGLPPPTYEWYKDGERLPDSWNSGYIIWKYGKLLVIRSDGTDDEGSYQCFARNEYGVAVSTKVWLKSAELLRFPILVEPTIHRPTIGKPLTLQCSPPYSYPPGHIYWIKQKPGSNTSTKQPPIIMDDRISLDYEGNLHFANVVDSDNIYDAIYMCVVQNDDLRSMSQGADARIYPIEAVGGKPQYAEPVVQWTSESPTVVLEGRTIKMKCIFSGFPTPEVHWSREGGPLPSNAKMESSGQELVISDARFEDHGGYACLAINKEGMDPVFSGVVLTVESLPFWTTEPESVDSSEEESAVFSCAAGGVPKPSVAWYVNGLPIEDEQKSNRKIDSDIITFTKLFKNDSQVLQCNASNIHGYIFKNVYLNVISEPKIPIVEDVHPLKGPKAGGTKVTIIGENFEHLINVLIGNQTIHFNCRNSTACFGVTSFSEIVNEPLPVKVKFDQAGQLVQLNMTYTFMDNPVLTEIYPRKTVPSGGNTVTVKGSSLDSVGDPKLNVTMVHTIHEQSDEKKTTQNTTSFISPCTAESSTTMKCVYPNMIIPKQFLNGTDFATSNTADSKSSSHDQEEILRLNLDHETLQFYIGFKLDGYKMYSNLSESLPNQSNLDIIVSKPQFESFQEVKVHSAQEHLVLWGKRIDLVFQPEDYLVTIGDQSCLVLEIAWNSLTCQPESPYKGSHDQHSVVVQARNLHPFYIGELIYGTISSLWWMYVVVGVILVIAILKCTQKKISKTDQTIDEVVTSLRLGSLFTSNSTENREETNENSQNEQITLPPESPESPEYLDLDDGYLEPLRFTASPEPEYIDMHNGSQHPLNYPSYSSKQPENDNGYIVPYEAMSSAPGVSKAHDKGINSTDVKTNSALQPEVPVPLDLDEDCLAPVNHLTSQAANDMALIKPTATDGSAQQDEAYTALLQTHAT